VTVLPQFSVIGDPLERCGLIICRPLADDPGALVELDVRRRRSSPRGRSVSEMHRRVLDQARVWSAQGRTVGASGIISQEGALEGSASKPGPLATSADAVAR
jgi:hypothetical protein